MQNINLKRQNHMEPNMRELHNMRHELEELIHQTEITYVTEEWQEVVSEIIRFQHEDGSFNLLDSYRIESDCRVAYCHEPTYICTALLMKALLFDKELFTGKEESILRRALHMCCARGLQGHGFDGLRGFINAVNYFISCDVKMFLTKYPNMCVEFTEMFETIQMHITERVEKQEFYGSWGENYEADIRKIHDYFSKTPIFVYGTLLNGQANHDKYLDGSILAGEGNITGYDMYNLGYYPGIISGDGTVSGEVYYVTERTLEAIDLLEGEGSLYIKTPVIVEMEGGKYITAWAYVYNHSVAGCERIAGRYGQEEWVWYVSYGSNMLEERLKYYIEGGNCSYNGKVYSACADKTLPCENRPVTIPYNMFYSNYNRGSWSDSAVSFLDLSKPGFAYGRAYKIKKSQLDEIHGKEGRYTNWYPECIRLENIEGIPAYTFAGYSEKNKESFSRVSAEYGIILYKGMKETYPELTDEEIFTYLQRCGR